MAENTKVHGKMANNMDKESISKQMGNIALDIGKMGKE
jgi:hypothetical protein